MQKVIVITGSGSGFGRLAAQTLAKAGHRVYATMRNIKGKNEKNAAALKAWAQQNEVSLSTLELDVSSEASASAAAFIMEKEGRVDVVINNAGMLVIGVTEAFTPEQMARVFDINATSWLRVNRAFLPIMRNQRDGLLLYIGSVTSSIVSPFQGPYVASKAAGDAIAVSTHLENSRYGIDSVIIQPGAYTDGTNHFVGAEKPADQDITAAYDRIAELPALLAGRLNTLNLPGRRTDALEVAEKICEIVAMKKGSRPLRLVVDPQHHGAEEVNATQLKMQHEFLARFGIADLMQVRVEQSCMPPTR